ncbi:hypothetical protein BJ987_005479 [Nocardia goodfellowii]|uniref:Uncharacterized protein n=1 Tax=Nocardia goodfellowii TaxID=882446 RepID=A0ABS4QNC5_9NOCA|nr:hypothetical protein [Nocardia goodfellowii]
MLKEMRQGHRPDVRVCLRDPAFFRRALTEQLAVATLSNSAGTG